jgi:hypothetical protein
MNNTNRISEYQLLPLSEEKEGISNITTISDTDVNINQVSLANLRQQKQDLEDIYKKKVSSRNCKTCASSAGCCLIGTIGCVISLVFKEVAGAMVAFICIPTGILNCVVANVESNIQPNYEETYLQEEISNLTVKISKAEEESQKYTG